MSDYRQYKEIFNKEITLNSKGIIFPFFPIEDKYRYMPYSHAISGDSVEKLGELMRKNLFFYAYGEEEIVNYYKKDTFSSLEKSAKFAYQNRIPKRSDITDGLPGEVLLDLLVQLYNPNAYKLAVRTIFRQNDNNEIKGYDLTYFTKDDVGISLWLGQAKLGAKDYCKKSINADLIDKYLGNYLTKQLFFVCDKRVSITENAKEILEMIETINIKTMNNDNNVRRQELINFFNDNDIVIKIPCLLAYDQEDVYESVTSIYNKIKNEVASIKRYFNKQTYKFKGFNPEIVFYVFPIKDIKRLKDKEHGFYAGLC